METRNGLHDTKSDRLTPTVARSRINTGVRPLVAALCMSLAAAALAAPVAVPNSDFSSAANSGSVGGGPLGGSGSAPIGAGPWNGSYAGVLGLLAPPQLTIGAGSATIDNLAVVALGIDNSGAFSQGLAAPYVAQKHYVLAADIDAGTSLLALNVLASGNAGLALTRGATVLASTQDADSIALSLASGEKFHLALGYDSGATVSGNIGVALFANPSGVLGVDLLSQIAFSKVVLTQAPIPALPPDAVAPAGGTPQNVSINTAFGEPLVVSVVDAEGDPLEGITVTFTAPASGAGATLSTTSVVTDVGGRAEVAATANGTPGGYMIVASVDGVGQAATFHLTNSPAGQPIIGGIVQSNQPQTTAAGTPFACMIAVQMTADSVPAAGGTVIFNAPPAGASAVLSDGTNSGSMLIETTDENGFAMVAATANDTAGSYDITATATSLTGGTLALPVLIGTWPMTNLAAGERVFADGFDPKPALCGN